jgi:hypothetical protein
MRAARDGNAGIGNGHELELRPSEAQCMRDKYDSYTSRIYHLRGVQKIRTSRVDTHPSPVHASRKVSNLLELSGKLIVLF